MQNEVSASAPKKLANLNSEKLIRSFERTGSVDLDRYLSGGMEKIADLFHYRQCLISTLIQKLEHNEKKVLQKIITHCLDQLCENIRNEAFNVDPDPEEEYKIQSYFETLALIIQLSKENFSISSESKSRIKVFESMFQNFLNRNYSPLVRWGSLWVMRVSFDQGDSERYRLKVLQRVLESLDSPEYFLSARKTDVYFSALIFLVKFFLTEYFSEYVTKIREKIKKFTKRCPLSGFIIYSYLTHGQTRFSHFLKPILCCTDIEPVADEEKLRGLLPLDVASRAVQAIGVLGDKQDFEVLKANGFLNICSHLPSENRQLGSIERLTYHAQVEVLHHRGTHELKPAISSSLGFYLTDVFRNKLRYIYDESNHSLSIYAGLYNNIKKRIKSFAMDSESQHHLSSTAGFILSSINEEYFEHKSYQNQGKLKLSLSLLNQQLEELHSSIESIFLVDESLEFEKETVGSMREIVKNSFKEKPQDLTDFSHISFTLWAEGKKLGDPDIPQFSDYVKGGLKETIMKHVKASNESILNSIESKWNSQTFSEIGEISFLDIGAGVGNTTEAIIKHFPEIKKNILAVELVPAFVKHYSRRIFMIMALQWCISKTEPNFDVTCVNMDIHRFLQSLEKNEQTIDFANNDKLKAEALDDMMKEKKFDPVYPTLTANYLKNICTDEHSVLSALDAWGGTEKDRKLWQEEFMEKYNKCFNTYSGMLTERAYMLQKKVQQVQEFVHDGTQEAEQQLAILRKLSRTGKLPEKIIKQVAGILDRCSGKVRSLFGESRPVKRRRYEMIQGFDVTIANYVLHHIIKEYRQQIYKLLLDFSKEYAFFAISDPLLGESKFNRRYFNFTDEGVFASFGSLGSFIEEVEEIKNEEGFYWEKVGGEPAGDAGFYVLFQKMRSEKLKDEYERLRSERRRQELKKDEIDIKELDNAISEINNAMKEHPELESDLTKLRKKLGDMKVASLELEKLEDDFERANITEDRYLVQRKKLRTDIERSRNEADLISILHKIEDEDKKSNLQRLVDAIKSNKDFILVVLEIVKATLKH